MKKFAIVFSLLALSVTAANAYIDNQYTATDKFLVNIGYSKETARVANIVNQDPYRDNYVEEKNLTNIARRIYHYIVPGQNDDLDFYNHSGSYNGFSWKDY